MKVPMMRAGTLAVTAAVAALGVPGVAQAFVGTPGTGARPETDAPDLESVTLAGNNAFAFQQAATYCFDAVLSDNFSFANFFIKTYDGGRYLQGTSAIAQSGGSGKCVVVQFSPQVDLAVQGSIGEVNAGAVRTVGASGIQNYFSSAPVTGSSLTQQAGRTTGPDLIGATPVPDSNTVVFEFDQPIDTTPANIAFASFGMVDAAGAETAGDDAPSPVVDSSNRLVRVHFPASSAVGNKVRYFARSGAVRSRAQTGVTGGSAHATTAHTLNPEGVVAGANTTRPVLTSATPRTGNASQFLLTYSDDLGTFNASGIIAVFDNGNVEAAVSATPVSGSTTQRVVSFPTPPTAQTWVFKEPAAVVSIVSRTGAARTATGDQASPISSIAVGPGAPAKPGYTNAPDLLTTTIDQTTRQVTFTYDEEIDPASAGDASRFVLLIPNGTPIVGSDVTGFSSDRKQVFVAFPGQVSAAVGVGNGQGAVRDFLNNPNPYSSVSTTLVAQPATDAVPVPTPTPAPPAPPPAAPAAPAISRFDTGITFKRSGKRLKGRLKSSGRGCRSGRRVVIKRSGKTIRAVSTRGDGTFQIALPKKTGKVYLFSTERLNKTTGVFCRSKKSSTYKITKSILRKYKRL